MFLLDGRLSIGGLCHEIGEYFRDHSLVIHSVIRALDCGLRILIVEVAFVIQDVIGRVVDIRCKAEVGVFGARSGAEMNTVLGNESPSSTSSRRS